MNSFSQLLKSLNITSPISTFSHSTHTSADAAAALGCQLGQIAKSLIFRTADSQALLIICSGSNFVDESKVEKIIGQKIFKADANFVRKYTGFTIGGVPPFGFPFPVKTIIDEDLLIFPKIWSAAGDPHSVFFLKPQTLVKITRGIISNVKKSPN